MAVTDFIDAGQDETNAPTKPRVSRAAATLALASAFAWTPQPPSSSNVVVARAVTADDGGLTRYSNLLYDPFACYVKLPAVTQTPTRFHFDADNPFVRKLARKPVDPLSTYVPLAFPGTAKPTQAPYDPGRVEVRRLKRNPVDDLSVWGRLIPTTPRNFFDASDPVGPRKVRRLLQETVYPFAPPATGAAGTSVGPTSADDGGGVTWSKLVYDPYAGPVLPPPPTAPAFVDTPQAPAKVWRRAPTLDAATPLQAPAAQTFVDVPQSPARVTRRTVSLEAVIPLAPPTPQGTPTPSAFGAWSSDILWTKLRDRKVQPSAFVFAIPDDIWLPADTDQPRTLKKRALPQEIASPPQNTGGQVAVGVGTGPTSADDGGFTRHSQVLYDPYAGPVSPPTAAAGTPVTTSFFFDADKTQVRPRVKVIWDNAAVFPVVAAQGTPTTTAFFYDADKPLVRRWFKPQWENASVFPPKVDVFLPSDVDQPQVRKTRRKDPEAFAYPFQAYGTPTATFLNPADTDQPPALKRWAKPLDAFTWQIVPPPPFVGTPVPSFLFDWTVNGPGYRISLKATTVNDGFTWDPQDPSTLTGVITPPEPPVVTPPSTGGGGVSRRSGPRAYPRRGVWIDAEEIEKKRRKAVIPAPEPAPAEIAKVTNVSAPQSLLSELAPKPSPLGKTPKIKTQAEIDDEDLTIIAIIESLD